MNRPTATLAWARDGERALAAVAGQLTDAQLDGPSLLPNWSRRWVLAHLAGNADALLNLLVWARTGVETPMYASPAARDQGIAATAALTNRTLLAEVDAAAQRLSVALDTLPEAAWTVSIRTAQGRTLPASAVPWMRCREAWVHAVDLGASFDDVPNDVCVALIDDVFRMWHLRATVPGMTVQTDGGHQWGGGSPTVSGPLREIAAWLTGRCSAAELGVSDIELPNWL